MRKYIFTALVFLLLTIISVQAQIENEIKAYVDSTEFIINNGKKMILEKVSEKDFSKTKEVYDYLNLVAASKHFAAFDYSEDILVNLLLTDYIKLSFLLKNYTQLSPVETYPGTDDIYPTLFFHVKNLSDSLNTVYQNSGLDNESKDLFMILLHLYKKEQTDEKYYSLLERYNEKYPSGQYKEFIRNYLPKGKNHTAVDLTIGTGAIFTTGKLAESFNPNIAFNISMDIIYKRLYTSLYVNIAGLKLQEPFQNISDSESWFFEKDETFIYFDGGIRVGILAVRQKKFRFGPFISVSGSYLESNRYDSESEYSEFQVFSTLAYSAGVYTEIKLKDFSESGSGSYLGLKFEAAFNKMNNIEDTYFVGNLPYMNLAFVWGFGDH